MTDNEKRDLNRRDFMKVTAAVAGSTLVSGGATWAETELADDGLDRRNERPETMRYRKLGRTNFHCSRLVFGCAALSGTNVLRLLETAYEQGVNHYDLGSNVYYKGAERRFAPFMKEHRDSIWVTSKAPVRAGFDRELHASISLETAKESAKTWTNLLDASLKDLDTEYVDAYYIMMVDQPALIKSEEMYTAFLKAKEAGKVKHFGISSHRRAQECLEAAAQTGWYDLAMVAICPAGWYDYGKKAPLENASSLAGLRPVLDSARDAGVGLVTMKAARYIAPRRGKVPADETAFDKHYSEKLLASPLNNFQRTYAYCLETGMDVVNADMPNFSHLEQNAKAVNSAHLYVA